MKIVQQRDLNILADLYRYRTLSGQQIKNVHFREKPKYIYRKLSLLKKEQLIESIQGVWLKNKKKGGCYFITEKGISLLKEHKMIESQQRRARDNKITGPALPHVIEINDLYSELIHYGWEFVPSREVKASEGMNRSALVRGALKDRRGKEYIVYFLEHDSKDETIERIANELKLHSFPNVIVLCKGKESYYKFQEAAKPVVVSGSLNVIPYPFALQVLKYFTDESIYFQLFSQYGMVTPIQAKNGFAEYEIDCNGEKMYIANYLLGDQMTRHFLSKYGPDRYQVDGRKVLLFAWEAQTLDLQQIIERNPYIVRIAPQFG